MLVLSRRESEKVLFPTLGITVEVTRIKGHTVRLGIEAPKEIRVIRGELEHRPELGYAKQSSPEPSQLRFELQKCLDAANLAIHLAQNQLRQDLSGHAEVALEQALECIEDLELAISKSHFDSSSPAVVKESNSGYQVRNKPTNPTAAVLASDESVRKRIVELLNQNGFNAVEFAEQGSLLRYLLHSEQPAVVVTRNGSDSQPGDEAVGEICQLQITGIAGLRRHSRSFSIDENRSSSSIQFTAWFSDDDLAAKFESKNQTVLV